MRQFLALLLALTAGTAAAQSCAGASLLDRLDPAARAVLAEAAEATPFGEGLFWQATRGEDRITLIGTMHLPDPRHDALVARAEPLIARADLLLLEMTPEEMDEMNAAMVADPGRIYLTEGPTLIDLMAPEDWALVAEAARLRQIPPFMAARFRPWFLMLTLSIPPCAMEDFASGGGGLDVMLMDLAEGAGVPMRALEPWDTLFTLMDEVPEQEQLDLVMSGLLDPQLQTEMFVAMLDGYFAGDVATIWGLTRVGMDLVPGLSEAEKDEMMALTEDLLLDRRNRAWMEGIDAAVAEADEIVVAVGAAHLPREIGVLRLLQEDGWTIAPLD